MFVPHIGHRRRHGGRHRHRHHRHHHGHGPGILGAVAAGAAAIGIGAAVASATTSGGGTNRSHAPAGPQAPPPQAAYVHPWSCTSCTFVNQVYPDKCGMCGTQRAPNAPLVQVQQPYAPYPVAAPAPVHQVQHPYTQGPVYAGQPQHAQPQAMPVPQQQNGNMYPGQASAQRRANDNGNGSATMHSKVVGGANVPPQLPGLMPGAPNPLPPRYRVPPANGSEPEWEKNSVRNACPYCEKSFSFLTRARHHCRECGVLLCDDCSKSKVIRGLYMNAPMRACPGCYYYVPPLLPPVPAAAAAPAPHQSMAAGYAAAAPLQHQQQHQDLASQQSHPSAFFPPAPNSGSGSGMNSMQSNSAPYQSVDGFNVEKASAAAAPAPLPPSKGSASSASAPPPTEEDLSHLPPPPDYTE